MAGRKDITKLIPLKVIDKRGRVMTVYARPTSWEHRYKAEYQKARKEMHAQVNKALEFIDGMLSSGGIQKKKVEWTYLNQYNEPVPEEMTKKDPVKELKNKRQIPVVLKVEAVIKTKNRLNDENFAYLQKELEKIAPTLKVHHVPGLKEDLFTIEGKYYFTEWHPDRWHFKDVWNKRQNVYTKPLPSPEFKGKEYRHTKKQAEEIRRYYEEKLKEPTRWGRYTGD